MREAMWAGSFGVLDGADPDFAPFLISRGARVDAHSAARLGMLDTLRQLIGANPELVHARVAMDKRHCISPAPSR